MQFATVVWYNPGNRFALIKPDDGRPRYLAQLTPEQAITAPLVAGQRFAIYLPDAEAMQGRNNYGLLALTASTPMRANEEMGQ
jgi:cold shock CspA family protein